MHGADADALDRLAQQMGQAADSLERSSSRITAALGSSPWRGQDAIAFRSHWNSSDRRLLVECARALREAASNLAHQSAEQRQASGSDGSGSTRSGLTGGTPGGASGGALGGGKWVPGLGILAALPGAMGQVWRDSDLAKVAAAAGLSGPLSFVAANKAVVGDYTKSWHRGLDLGKRLGLPDDLLRFKKSDTLQFLQPKLHPFSKYLDAVDSTMGRVSPILNALNLAGHAQEIGESVAQDGGFGFRSAVATSETGADALKMSKNPVSYLGGMAVQSWTEVAKAVKSNADDGNFSVEAVDRLVTYVPQFGWKDWRDVATGTAKDLVSPLTRILL